MNIQEHSNLRAVTKWNLKNKIKKFLWRILVIEAHCLFNIVYMPLLLSIRGGQT